MKSAVHVMTETPIVERMTELLIQKGKTQKELVENLGLQKNTYSEWKAGRNTSYLKYIDDIASFLDISPTYLLRGMEYDSDEIELIRLFRKLDDTKRKRLLQLVAEM